MPQPSPTARPQVYRVLKPGGTFVFVQRLRGGSPLQPLLGGSEGAVGEQLLPPAACVVWLQSALICRLVCVLPCTRPAYACRSCPAPLPLPQPPANPAEQAVVDAVQQYRGWDFVQASHAGQANQ